MAVLSELRNPTTRVAKALSGLLAIVLFAFVSVATVAGFLLFQILRPPRNPAAFDLGVMMGQPSAVTFSISGRPDREGWFFPGLRGAPTIVLCHGYLSQRAEVLTLASSLQEQQFNVFVFDFTGHGSVPGVSGLGYKETAELGSAIDALAKRDDVDPKRFGLWGVDLGGYTVLEVSSVDPRIAAFAVDDAYPDPRIFLRIQVNRSGLAVIPYVSRFAEFGFRIWNYPYRHEPPVTLALRRTKGIPKLFIQSDDQPGLAIETQQLYLGAPDPKQTLRHRLSYSQMADDDRHAYENEVVTFFLQNMPPAGGH
jgi:pimeloyl-ACP methyl ester carboxylesterase